MLQTNFDVDQVDGRDVIGFWIWCFWLFDGFFFFSSKKISEVVCISSKSRSTKAFCFVKWTTSKSDRPLERSVVCFCEWNYQNRFWWLTPFHLSQYDLLEEFHQIWRLVKANMSKWLWKSFFNFEAHMVARMASRFSRAIESWTASPSSLPCCW